MVSKWNSIDQGFWVPAVIYAKPAYDSGYVFVSGTRNMFQLGGIYGNVEDINFVSISFADSPDPIEFYPLTVRYANHINLNPVSMHFDFLLIRPQFYLEIQDSPVFSAWD